MKQVGQIAVLVAVAALFMSCAKDGTGEEPGMQNKDLRTLTASVESNDAATRTELGPKENLAYPTLWLAGDEIVVADGSSTATYSTENNGVESAEFTISEGDPLESKLLLAYYPASRFNSASVIEIQGEECLSVFLPGTQQYRTDNIARNSYPMVARAESFNAGSALGFKNLCGIVRVRLTSELNVSVKSVQITAKTPLWGAAQVTYNGTDTPSISSIGDGGSNYNTVILSCGAGGVALSTEATDFHIVLPPSAGYENLKIRVMLTDNTSQTFTSNKPIEVVRSMITTLSLAVNKPMKPTAKLTNGKAFNEAMKSLAGNLDSIKTISPVYDNTTALPGEMEVQDAGSMYKVYLSWNAQTQTITVRTPAKVIVCNPDAYRMFDYCRQLTSLDLSGLDTSQVTNMGGMFSRCTELTSLDLSGFDTSQVTNMKGMFQDCYTLTSLDLSGFDTSQVTNMMNIFSFCQKLTSLDLSSFDTSNVTNMNSMFASCRNLASLDITGFDTSNVTDMSSMFTGCENLISLDLRGFDTSKVTTMTAMFEYCRQLTSLDLRGFDTSNVTIMAAMFQLCYALARLDLSSFDMSKCDMKLHMCKFDSTNPCTVICTQATRTALEGTEYPEGTQWQIVE